MLHDLTVTSGVTVSALALVTIVGLRYRLWTVIPILPHLFLLWLPCVVFLALRRLYVWLRAGLNRQQRTSAGPLHNADCATLAVVIPCFNVQDSVRRVVTLARSCASRPVHIFAVDSASHDGTWQVLQQLHAEGLLDGASQSAQGRSNALNTGAALAIETCAPQLLMFLHSDTTVPAQYDTEVRRILASAGTALGYFQFAWETAAVDNPALAFNQWYVNVRCLLFQLPWGDQAYFLRTELFEQMNGFPAVPLMEDMGMLLACEKLGAVQPANTAIRTRAKKFLDRRPDWRCLKQMVQNHALTVAWICGVLTEADVHARYYKGVPLPVTSTFETKLRDLRNKS